MIKAYIKKAQYSKAKIYFGAHGIGQLSLKEDHVFHD